MMDLLSLSVQDVLKPGVIALVSQEGMVCQVLHTRSIVKLIGRLIDELEGNRYRNRVIQEKYNIQALEIKLLGYVDVSGIDSIHIKDLILRQASLGYCKQLHGLGYTLANNAPPVEFTVKTVLESRVRAKSPQVAVTIARGTRYYVQVGFNSMAEAEAYVANTDILQILKDTAGSRKPNSHVIPRELRPVGKKEDRRKYNKGRPKAVVEVPSNG
jgi:hypothetical protein